MLVPIFLCHWPPAARLRRAAAASAAQPAAKDVLRASPRERSVATSCEPRSAVRHNDSDSDNDSSSSSTWAAGVCCCASAGVCLDPPPCHGATRGPESLLVPLAGMRPLERARLLPHCQSALSSALAEHPPMFSTVGSSFRCAGEGHSVACCGCFAASPSFAHFLVSLLLSLRPPLRRPQFSLFHRGLGTWALGQETLSTREAFGSVGPVWSIGGETHGNIWQECSTCQVQLNLGWNM